MATAYLLLGADLGDKKATFATAREQIAQCIGKVVNESSLYQSAPWGFESDTTFLNQVVEVETTLTPHQLLDSIQEIERKLGRVRSANGYESRLIDIDILFYDNLVLSTERLTIPHPLLHERMFTLEPLYELIPDFIHPILSKVIAELRASCADSSVISKV